MAELPFDAEEIEQLVLRFNAVMVQQGEADDLRPADEAVDDELPDAREDGEEVLTEEELVNEIEGMNEEQQHALIALFWIGREDAEPEEWDATVELARERHEGSVSGYLLRQPMVSEYLETGLERLRESGELD